MSTELVAAGIVLWSLVVLAYLFLCAVTWSNDNTPGWTVPGLILVLLINASIGMGLLYLLITPIIHLFHLFQ